MKKRIIIIAFIIMYLLVTFFGLGPVLLADGSFQERMITLAAVIAIYILLTMSLRRFLTR